MNPKKVLFIFIFVVIIVCVVYPNLKKCYETENWTNTEKEIKFDINNDSILKVDKLRCSRDCCKFNQWPLPIELQVGQSEFIGSNFSCNNGGTSGCVCIESDNMNTLGNHAGNLVNNSCNK